MITVNESLAEYLRVLKEYQGKNNFSVIHRKSVLVTTQGASTELCHRLSATNH